MNTVKVLGTGLKSIGSIASITCQIAFISPDKPELLQTIAHSANLKFQPFNVGGCSGHARYRFAFGNYPARWCFRKSW